VVRQATAAYDGMRVRVRDWVAAMNAQLEAGGHPLRVASYSSVWTMLFTQPGRYHW
jgi:glutamate-1-semialdehyde 2,1-aminomutase